MLRCGWDWTRYTSLKWVEGASPRNTRWFQNLTAFEMAGVATGQSVIGLILLGLIIPIPTNTVMPKKFPVENRPIA